MIELFTCLLAVGMMGVVHEIGWSRGFLEGIKGTRRELTTAPGNKTKTQKGE